MRLIDGKRLSKLIEGYGIYHPSGLIAGEIPVQDVLDCIENEPIIEAEPVRYAHWEEYGGKKGNYWCTGCGMVWRKKRPTYCPHCGARMFPKEEPTDDQ